MPRFYIDVRGHFGTREDLFGIDLPDLAAAKSEALRIAGEILSSWSGTLPSYYDEITIEVRGEDLRPLVMIPYDECVKGARAAGLINPTEHGPPISYSP